MLKAGYWGAMIRSRRLFFFPPLDSEISCKRFNSISSLLRPFPSLIIFRPSPAPTWDDGGRRYKVFARPFGAQAKRLNSVAQPAAVDDNCLAGHIAGGAGNQENGGPPEFIRDAPAVHRNPAQNALIALFVLLKGFGQLGFEPA